MPWFRRSVDPTPPNGDHNPGPDAWRASAPAEPQRALVSSYISKRGTRVFTPVIYIGQAVPRRGVNPRQEVA
jgi:hypothetical protein